MAGLATAGAGAAALGLFSRAKGRLLVQGPGAFAPACALGMQSFVGSARLWAGAAGGSAAFHTTAPCEARLRMRGTVVSDKAQKSVVVAVERIFKHPVVKKFVTERSKFMAHDELDQFKVRVRRLLCAAAGCRAAARQAPRPARPTTPRARPAALRAGPQPCVCAMCIC